MRKHPALLFIVSLAGAAERWFGVTPLRCLLGVLSGFEFVDGVDELLPVCYIGNFVSFILRDDYDVVGRPQLPMLTFYDVINWDYCCFESGRYGVHVKSCFRQNAKAVLVGK